MPAGRVTRASRMVAVAGSAAPRCWGRTSLVCRPVGAPALWLVGVASKLGAKGRPWQSVMSGRGAEALKTWPGSW